jgi:hypothetical protein
MRSPATTGGHSGRGSPVFRPESAWAALAAISGLETALLPPNLMALDSDAVHPSWRSARIGVYRMWRDAGYGVGVTVIGLDPATSPSTSSGRNATRSLEPHILTGPVDPSS